MLHCDAETLALVALGARLAPDEQRHLTVCARCQAELDQNTSVVASGRTVTPDDEPVDPPPAVWGAIAAELGMSPGITPFLPDEPDLTEQAQVISLAQHRKQEKRTRRQTAWIAVAASVVGIALGAVGASTLFVGSEADSGNIIAETQLSTVPIDAGGSEISTNGLNGIARIVDTDGQDFAEVDARGLPELDGYYEVWLIRSDLSGMISLGALSSGSRGKFTIPPGTDLNSFTIIDVSVESLNGDPAHSKESVLRGTLQV